MHLLKNISSCNNSWVFSVCPKTHQSWPWSHFAKLALCASVLQCMCQCESCVSFFGEPQRTPMTVNNKRDFVSWLGKWERGIDSYWRKQRLALMVSLVQESHSWYLVFVTSMWVLCLLMCNVYLVGFQFAVVVSRISVLSIAWIRHCEGMKADNLMAMH